MIGDGERGSSELQRAVQLGWDGVPVQTAYTVPASELGEAPWWCCSESMRCTQCPERAKPKPRCKAAVVGACLWITYQVQLHPRI